MDQDRYDWSSVFQRPPVSWPGNARVALLIITSLEWFPLDAHNMPGQTPGNLPNPYPDYWNYTNRDYGNRIGIFRVMQVLDQFKLRSTAAVNAAVCDRYPRVVDQALKRGWELMGHGIDMGHVHHSGLSRDAEVGLVEAAISKVREWTGQPVRGWLSPGNAQSKIPLDLFA
jgi:hypothetical protein